LTEAILLARAEDNVYRHGMLLAVMALAFLVWFWLTVGRILAAAGRAAAVIQARWPRAIWMTLFAAAMVVLLPVVVLYAGSWGLYLSAGQFADVPSFAFAMSHSNWVYFLTTERARLGRFGLAILAVWLPLILVLARAPRHTGADYSPPRALRLAWYASTLLWASLLLVVNQHSMYNWFRHAARVELLSRRLHPVAALAASGYDAVGSEKIEHCLTASDLRPIAGTAWQPPAPTPFNRPSVIFLAVEALRCDAVGLQRQGRVIMPNLTALARECVQFAPAYSQSTHTDYAMSCVPLSLFPLRSRQQHFCRPDDPWPRTHIGDLLKRADYATAMVSSADETWCGMDCYLRCQQLDYYSDALHDGRSAGDPGWEQRFERVTAPQRPDAETTDVAIGWIRRQATQSRPFYLQMYFGSTHFPYPLPPCAEHPFQPWTNWFDASFAHVPEPLHEVVRNSYFNAQRECDRQIGRLVAALRETGLFNNTIMVIYGDHGEALDEHGLWLHARQPYEAAVRTTCLMHLPQAVPRLEQYPFELVDVAPTVLAAMHWPAHPNFQGIDALAPDRPPADRRLIFLHTQNPLTSTDAVVLGGRWKLMFHRNVRTDPEELYDLATDPWESKNLVADRADVAGVLRRALRTWRQRQLAYYEYADYYRDYYPPAAPQ
jgi:arylsulfatase A-like enzyme